MDKKVNFSLKKLKEIPKNQLLIGGLIGILLLVIAIPTEQSSKGTAEKKEETTVSGTAEAGDGTAESNIYEAKLEQKLKQILESMEGVGKVEVMITLKDEGESVVEKDIGSSRQNVTEEDGTVKRTTEDSQSQEETVYSQTDGSGQEPFVSKEVVPQVEGVLVVAQGGGNPTVAKNISDAVLALFPVEVHKIKVVKMN